jgi:hypothetical protein
VGNLDWNNFHVTSIKWRNFRSLGRGIEMSGIHVLHKGVADNSMFGSGFSNHVDIAY